MINDEDNYKQQNNLCFKRLCGEQGQECWSTPATSKSWGVRHEWNWQNNTTNNLSYNAEITNRSLHGSLFAVNINNGLSCVIMHGIYSGAREVIRQIGIEISKRRYQGAKRPRNFLQLIFRRFGATDFQQYLIGSNG
ncbi:hypothetical protein Ddye_011624 [Dipteronia dyeriana]|uniref:Uncharacterized protein n=1 Tax=Dipteronia dyeriana TaxID=168575 RepID=A0AAD9X2V5_9ROSI|nr:hypothetical protein Ddye_011624 [Dipteronia dyeriana]